MHFILHFSPVVYVKTFINIHSSVFSRLYVLDLSFKCDLRHFYYNFIKHSSTDVLVPSSHTNCICLMHLFYIISDMHFKNCVQTLVDFFHEKALVDAVNNQDQHKNMLITYEKCLISFFDLIDV